MRRTSPVRGLATQTELSPTATPETPRPSCSGLPESRPVTESIRERVPSRALVTQTDRSPAASRSGPWPTAIGSETAISSPRNSSTAAAAATHITARTEIASQGRRRQDAEPLPQRRRWRGDHLGRASGRVGEDAGRRRRRALMLTGGVDQSARGRKALRRVLGDGAFDHGVEARGDLGLGVLGLACVGDDPGQRLIEDAAERVDVGSRADAPPLPLLGGHVFDRAGDRGAVEDAGVAQRLGEAEVREEGAVAFDQDVVGLDVAVDDAGGVGGVERAGDLAEQLDRLGGGQRAAGRDPPLQVAALDQPHRDDQLAVLLASVVDRDHAWMVEPRGEP